MAMRNKEKPEDFRERLDSIENHLASANSEIESLKPFMSIEDGILIEVPIRQAKINFMIRTKKWKKK
jgi:hypothetical protein